jgi:ribosomal protein S18 acetylase RimI-like enzyme
MAVNLRTALLPGDVGLLISLHGRIYNEGCGYDHRFEGYVCKTFYDLFQNYSPEKDRFWFAEDNGRMVGAIAIVGHSAEVAQLRWFILEPAYRGQGLGRQLMNEAMQYCRSKGYHQVFLYTTDEQKVAIHMYEQAGFRKIGESACHEWGKTLVEQRYEVTL